MLQINLEELDVHHDYLKYCTLLAQLTSIDLEKISKNDFKDHLEKIKLNPYHYIIVAKYDNEIIGSITVLIEPKFIHNLSFVAHIEDVIVDKSYRKNGVGKLLMMHAISLAKQYKCYKIILDCNEKNFDFYQRFGFKIKESQLALYF